MHTDNKSWWWILIACWSLALLPWLFGHGIFVDGLYYGTMSRNWSLEGKDFWHFQLSESSLNPFYGHPPLALWMEALFFKVLGDYWFVDRIYSLVICLLTGFGIYKIWTLYFEKNTAWIPLFFWLLFPTTAWSYSNNILENSLALFSTWSAFFILSVSKNSGWSIFKLVFSGFLVFAAVLCKGPVGLFPLAIPFIALIWNLSIGQFFRALIPVISFLLTFYLLLHFNEAAFEYYQKYIALQISGTFQLEQVSGNRFLILKRLAEEILPVMLLFGILYLIFRNKINRQEFDKKQSLLLLMIALSASLPILISPKQMGFYLLPSFPFWAMAFGALFYPFRKYLMLRRTLIISLLSFSLLIFSISWMIYNFDRPVKDEEIVSDVLQFKQIIPVGKSIGIMPELFEDWKTQGYFYRYNKSSLYSIGHAVYEFQVVDVKNPPNWDSAEIISQGKKYALLKCSIR